MNARSIGFPSNPSLDQEYKKWMWDGDKWTAMTLTNYDDTELRALISANSTRIDALENAPPVDAYTKAESDGKYQAKGDYALNGASYTKAESDGAYVPKTGDTTVNGTLTAKDMVATG